MNTEKQTLTYLNSNQQLQKIIKKEIIKDNKILANNFQMLGIINSYGYNSKILYRLLRKLNTNCAYISNTELCYKQKVQFCNEHYYTELNLNALYNKLKSEGITHIIFNMSPEQYESISSLQFDYCIINDINISTPKEIQVINKIIKRTKKKIIVCSEDKLYKKLRYKDRHITLGKSGNYNVNNYVNKSNSFLIHLEHLYNVHNISITTHNPHIIKTHLLSIILVSQLEYDLQEVINKYKKIKNRD